MTPTIQRGAQAVEETKNKSGKQADGIHSQHKLLKLQFE